MLYSIVSAQCDNEGMLISDSSRFSSFDKLTMSVQFTVTSMYWSPPRWPSLWWSLSRPESFRCLVAELIRWSSQTMREVRLERSWVQAYIIVHIVVFFKCTVILFNFPYFIWYFCLIYKMAPVLFVLNVFVLMNPNLSAECHKCTILHLIRIYLLIFEMSQISKMFYILRKTSIVSFQHGQQFVWTVWKTNCWRWSLQVNISEEFYRYCIFGVKCFYIIVLLVH